MKYNKENNEWLYNEKELKNAEGKGEMNGFIFGLSSGFFIMLIVWVLVSINEPSAIDVYRGKTELKVEKTYIGDSISKIDTIVIFKK